MWTNMEENGESKIAKASSGVTKESGGELLILILTHPPSRPFYPGQTFQAIFQLRYRVSIQV